MTFCQLLVCTLAVICFAPKAFSAAQPQGTGTRYNQLGYLPRNYKNVVVPSVKATRFHLLSLQTKEKMYSAPLSNAQHWALADQTIKIADLSGFAFLGDYQLKIDGLKNLPVITIQKDIYRQPLLAALKSFYLNRASVPLEETFAGVYARPAGHADTLVFLHESAASEQRPAGTTLSAAKGWYDGSSYSKLTVRAASAAMFLLRAYADYPELFSQLTTYIPESSNEMPDVLDELRWSLDWMLAMQDPNDGGVYHQLSTELPADVALPHTQNQRRYVLAKSTPAALTFAATMARAAQTYKAFDSVLAAQYKQAALQAYAWAELNPALAFVLPKSFKVSVHGNSEDDYRDELSVASVELYLLTGKKKFLKQSELPERITTPNANRWDVLTALGLLDSKGASAKLKASAQSVLLSLADSLVTQHDKSAYKAAIVEEDYTAASNETLLAKIFVLLHANALQPKVDYEIAMSTLIDYLFGRNPVGYSFVTGFGKKLPENIHHRISQADAVKEPIPGLIVAGASIEGKSKPECQDKSVIFKTNFPAKAYADHQCRRSTNSVSITANAMLVYVLAGQN